MTSFPEESSCNSETPDNIGADDSTRDDGIQADDRTGPDREPFPRRDPQPVQIGRYEILEKLGKGGFGNVYRAFDPELNCDVAVKVPRPDRRIGPVEMERFRNEARTLARIRNRPEIVTVYDVGQTDAGIVFAVMEFVAGNPLSTHITDTEPGIDESLQILMELAAALKTAHEAGVVHRDVKPANVILDKRGKITLVDFGLALHDDLALDEVGSEIAGTYKYMAPEQIRGENHRIDGRTDIWAWGVIMYRMLIGKHPFRARNEYAEWARVIRYKEPVPLRQLNSEIPKEIDRICLKCLSKMMVDRYQSMADLIDELSTAIVEIHEPDTNKIDAAKSELEQIELQTQKNVPGLQDSQRTGPSARTDPSITDGTSLTQQLQITYKGLRPFDSNDRDFFLELLPGPRTRKNIPESIQFWCSRILGDELEPLQVGLIYGPSGCGKSSFVRAGLLPLLPAQANPVYLECTIDNTEKRLARQIAHQIHSVIPEDSLPDILRQFRRGEHLADDDKLVIVLDQFEQWLHGSSDFAEQELTEALRQCDGEKICCILLIRDDFWMSTSQFMRTLEIPIREGQNALALPLFDERHARKVLVAYGRSFQRLPQSTDEEGSTLNPQQKRFIRDAVDSLSENGKVICVHLTVFAEMMKSREWTHGQLRREGGWEGLGVQFLNDIFSSPQTPHSRRNLTQPIQKILQDLLPERMTDIKGEGKSLNHLQEIAGLDDDSGRFAETIHCLSVEYPLISPVETSVEEGESDNDQGGEIAYRLSHDFLVNPIRTWLRQVQTESKMGRAALRLEELENHWGRSRERRFLPTFPEYISIAARVPRRRWSENGRALMRQATQFYGLVALFIVLFVAGGYFLTISLFAAGATNVVQKHIDEIIVGTPDSCMSSVASLERYRETAGARLSRYLEHENPKIRARAASALLLLDFVNPENVRTLVNQIPLLEQPEFEIVETALGNSRNQAAEQIQSAIEDSENEFVRARLSITAWYLGFPEFLKQMFEVATPRDRQTALIDQFPNWHGSLTTIADSIAKSQDLDYQYTMCAAIGRIVADDMDDDQRRQCIRLFHQLHQNSNDPGVIQVCNWALNRWNSGPPGQSANDPIRRTKVYGQHELTFVTVAAGKFVRHEGTIGGIGDNRRHAIADAEIDSPFLMSATEVPYDLFRQFVKDQSIDPKSLGQHFFERWDTDTTGLPACGVSRLHAAKFLNWLSEQNELEHAYQFDEDTIRLVEGANGFRLPDMDEWEYTCKASTRSPVFWGTSQEVAIAQQYEQLQLPRVGPLAPIQSSGQKIPNRFGFFDMMGNVEEICDLSESYTKSNSEFREPFSVRRGGHVKSNSRGLSAAVWFPNWDKFDAALLGFRIVLPVGK